MEMELFTSGLASVRLFCVTGSILQEVFFFYRWTRVEVTALLLFTSCFSYLF